MEKLYSFITNDNQLITVLYNTVYEDILLYNDTKGQYQEHFNDNDDCITLIDGYDIKIILIESITDFFVENVLKEMEDRFENNELNQNSLLLYKLTLLKNN